MSCAYARHGDWLTLCTAVVMENSDGLWDGSLRVQLTYNYYINIIQITVTSSTFYKIISSPTKTYESQLNPRIGKHKSDEQRSIF